MKVMKKVLALMLVAGMALGLVACGDNNKQNGDVTTVTVWTANGHDKAFLEKEIKEWNDTVGAKEGIKIEYVVQDSIANKLDLAFETDQAPDLFSGGSMSKYAELGYIAPYEDIPGGDKLIEKFQDYLMYGRHMHTDGKTYFLPKSATTYGLIYNKDMFRAAGIVDENGEPTPPETLAELREYAQKLTNVKERKYGYIIAGKTTLIYADDVMKMSSATSGYADGYNPKTGVFDFSHEATVMKTMLGIKADGSCYPGTESTDNDQARARFAAGDIGMKTAGSYDYGVLTSQFPTTIDWGVAPYPTEVAGNRQKQHMGNYGYLMINRKAADEKAEAVAKVLEFFYSDELIKKSYMQGIDIPLNLDIVKSVELPAEMKQWQEFAELLNVSQATPIALSRDLQGERVMRAIYVEDVWSGKVTDVDKVCADYSALQNEGAKRYADLHPEYKPENYIIPDFESAIEK